MIATSTLHASSFTLGCRNGAAGLWRPDGKRSVKTIKFIDMFCGMGTIRMGFEQAGHECVYSIEFDKHKRRIYEVIFGHEPGASDIRAVRGTDLPISDCWCFGAPCQDFSVAGLRAGLDGDRSGLVREVFRLVREKEPADRPEWLLYENVKGMLSSNSGWDFAAIQTEMGELGYDVQWQLLNSKNFGVPQNRERVYTLGHLRTRGERKVFPIGYSNAKVDELSGQECCSNTVTAKYGNGLSNGTYVFESERQAQVKQIGNVMPTTTRNNPNQGRVYDPEGLAPCLNKMEGGGREPMIAYGVYPNASPEFQRPPLKELSRCLKADGNHPAGVLFTQKKITRETDIAGTLTARNPSTSRGNNTPITGVIISPDGISSADTAFTLKAGKHGPAGVDENHPQNGVQQGTRIRRLTPRECMRLQGVLDCITDKLIAAGISDTQMYRAAGDACTVNVIYEIAKRLEVIPCRNQ